MLRTGKEVNPWHFKLGNIFIYFLKGYTELEYFVECLCHLSLSVQCCYFLSLLLPQLWVVISSVYWQAVAFFNRRGESFRSPLLASNDNNTSLHSSWDKVDTTKTNPECDGKLLHDDRKQPQAATDMLRVSLARLIDILACLLWVDMHYPWLK